jgi:hypothetical protein
MSYAHIPDFSQPVPARSDSARTGRRRLSADGRFLNLPNETPPGTIEPWQAVYPIRPDTAHSRAPRFLDVTGEFLTAVVLIAGGVFAYGFMPPLWPAATARRRPAAPPIGPIPSEVAMPLSNPFRRAADRPTLRERAAALRSRLGPPTAEAPAPVTMPEPGSAEAMAAFHAACHEHTIRTEFANGYPDLKRTSLEWWTADSLSKAMESGEITPSECARLYPLATEGELRMAEIEHELKLGALHALAFADSYPLPSDPADDEAPDDAGLVRLGQLFEAARAREVAACEACNAAGRTADKLMPWRPEVLTLRTSDHPLRIYRMLTYPTALEGHQLTASDIDWLRGRMPMMQEVLRPVRPGERTHIDHPGRRFEIVPHPEAQARAEEIITAWDAWQGVRNRICGKHLTQELEDVADAAGAATEGLAERIANCSAHTAAGFRVKLRALNHYRRDTLLAEIPSDPDPDQILSHSLYRDLQDEPPAAPEDAGTWDAPPPGFMAYPEREPATFIIIKYGLRLELERLLRIARAEFERRTDGETSGDQIARVRQELRLDALTVAVRGEASRATDILDRDLSREAFDYAHGLNLTAIPFRNLIRLYEVFHRTADLLNDAAQEDQFWAQANSGIYTAGGTVIDAEQNRLACIRDVCAMELAKRTPASEADRDAALVIRLRHEMLCEAKIQDKALLGEIREAWGG